ncbi:MAG TPA: ATP synthase F1 subunit gamma [Planctomycetota bacterium]|nr:ATP synthase F1 subunit gamma [Planctomycetota bacterium]
MASVRDLRVRIRSVGNIKQITRAMEMVAATKLRRFQDRAVASRPYALEIAQLLARMAGAMGERLEGRPQFRPGEGEAVGVLLIASDRGLCGPYNSQLFAALERWLRERPGVDVRYWVIGRKAFQYLTKRGRQVERYLVEPPLEQVDYRMAKYAARLLSQAFLAGTLREVYVFYTAFESMARYVPTPVRLLPVQREGEPRGEGKAGGEAAAREAAGDVILEPDLETLLERLVPRYLETRIYNAMLESITSEYASRRLSMKNATDAASDMQSILKNVYNRKRQESITKDLLDIVGGAEALR